MTEQEANDEWFGILLLQVIERAQNGDYSGCAKIVEAFRKCLGEDAAKKVRRVLWTMIKEYGN